MATTRIRIKIPTHIACGKYQRIVCRRYHQTATTRGLPQPTLTVVAHLYELSLMACCRGVVENVFVRKHDSRAICRRANREVPCERITGCNRIVLSRVIAPVVGSVPLTNLCAGYAFTVNRHTVCKRSLTKAVDRKNGCTI